MLVKEDEPAYFDLSLDSPLEQLSAAVVRYRIAVGPQAGRKTMTPRSAEAQSEEVLWPSRSRLRAMACPSTVR